MGPPPDDHNCGWKTRATDLEAKLEETSAKLEEVAAKMAAMERRILGPKSEKLRVAEEQLSLLLGGRGIGHPANLPETLWHPPGTNSTMLFATLAGLIPAIHAAKMNVIEAIRHR